MKLRHKAQDITLKLVQEILNEAETDPVGTWAFEAITVPHCCLHFR
ncbi:hypothetical protein A2U01_0075998, partial [Trifolium medium]|nr:hypothetical protein [Trifolium medium]